MMFTQSKLIFFWNLTFGPPPPHPILDFLNFDWKHHQIFILIYNIGIQHCMWVIYTHLCNMKLYKNGIIKILFVPDQGGNCKKIKGKKKWGGWQILYLERWGESQRCLGRFQIEMEIHFDELQSRTSGAYSRTENQDSSDGCLRGAS